MCLQTRHYRVALAPALWQSAASCSEEKTLVAARCLLCARVHVGGHFRQLTDKDVRLLLRHVQPIASRSGHMRYDLAIGYHMLPESWLHRITT